MPTITHNYRVGARTLQGIAVSFDVRQSACGQRRLFIEMAPRNEIVSASLLQRVSPLYSTFQPYICSATRPGLG
jgi:hypothetical protein